MMLRKDKRTISIALVSLLALSIFATTSGAFAAPPNPLDEILNTINNVYGYLTGTIKPELDGINTKTDAIKNEVDKGPQVLTRSGTVTFLAGTGLVDFRVSISIEPDNKAADFRVTFATLRGDWTTGPGDRLELIGICGSGEIMSLPVEYYVDVWDEDLNDLHWEAEFTARYMRFWASQGPVPLEQDVTLCYSYTVTTEAGATIIEDIYFPPS